MKFVDLDELIEEKCGISIREIFDQCGEHYFRVIEREVVTEVSTSNVKRNAKRNASRQSLVVATGGGVVLENHNVANLKNMGCMIHLYARPDVILKRTKDAHHRPLLEMEDREKEVHHLLMERRPFYSKADYEIDTSELTIEDVVEKIMRHLQESSNGAGTG